MTDDHVERVRSLVAAIPAGRISTYGDIADAAGLSSPRVVGWIMRTDSADLPWHRVIAASGRPARHLAGRQLELLRAEGIPDVGGRIPLRDYRHRFPPGRRGGQQPRSAGAGREARRSGKSRDVP